MNIKLIAFLFIAFICQVQLNAQVVAHIEDGVLKVCKQHKNKIHGCESRRKNVKFAVINTDQTIIAIVYNDGKLELCKLDGTDIDAGKYEKENVASVEFGMQNTLIVTYTDNKTEYCELDGRRVHSCRKR